MLLLTVYLHTRSLHDPLAVRCYPITVKVWFQPMTGHTMNMMSLRQVSIYLFIFFVEDILFIHSFIHSFQCHVQNAQLLAILRSFFHSSLLRNLFCDPSPPTILPSSLTSFCHLFLGLPLNLVVPKFIHNILLGIIFSSILCICPNQYNIFNLIVSIIVGF